LKRGGGRRYYRPDDVDLLKGIRALLYGEGYTIRGVQRILKEQGLKYVISIGLESDGAPPVKPDPARLARFDQEEDEDRVPTSGPERREPRPMTDERREPRSAPEERREPRQGEERREPPVARPTNPGPAMAPIGPTTSEPRRLVPDAHTAPPNAASKGASPYRPTDPLPPAAAGRPVPAAPAVAPPVERAPEPLPAGILPPNAPPREANRVETGARSAFSFIDRLTGDKRPPSAAEPPAPKGAMSRDDIRKLQSTLFELLECKRMLDQARG
jgi:DNA-binding transcriptional MerR regulator